MNEKEAENGPFLKTQSKIDRRGCGSVGRAVASDTRCPRFESSHWHTFIWNICLLPTVLKRRNKIKRVREWPILLKKD